MPKKIIPEVPPTQSMLDLEQAMRAYQPPGAIVPPAAFAKDGVSVWTLAKLLDEVPIPKRDSLDAVVDHAARRRG